MIREAAHGPDHISMPLVAVAPDHVRPSWTRAIKITVICLALWLGPVVASVYAFGWDNVFSNIGLFFSKMAVITFGGAYAGLAYMAQQAVEYFLAFSRARCLSASVWPKRRRAADQRRAIRGIYGGFPPSGSRSDGRRHQRVPNEAFIDDYNARFAKAPLEDRDVHRPLAGHDDLDDAFAWKEQRTVSMNLTLAINQVLFILEPNGIARSLTRKRVTVIDYPDGQLAIRYNGVDLPYRTFDK